MDAPLRERVRRIFEEAIGRPPAERASWIDAACRGDSALRGEVRALLAAHEGADGFLADSTVGLLGRAFPGIADPLDALWIGPGSQVGRYRILEELGEGGFGVVYMAEQREPVRRQVALKVIKFGMDTRARLELFVDVCAAVRPCVGPHDSRPPFSAEVLGGFLRERGVQPTLGSRRRQQYNGSVSVSIRCRSSCGTPCSRSDPWSTTCYVPRGVHFLNP